MLNVVQLQVPEIYKFCHLSYSDPSLLKFNSQMISAEEGAQQGDPLGLLLFCLAIHPILLDDIILGGEEDSLSRDLQEVRIQGEAMDLRLNVKKCEYISHTSSSSDTMFREIIHLIPNEASLLGASINTGRAKWMMPYLAAVLTLHWQSIGFSSWLHMMRLFYCVPLLVRLKCCTHLDPPLVQVTRPSNDLTFF